MKRKPYWEMTRGELARSTKEFDAPFVIENARPLSAAERKEWQRLKRKRGRVKAGLGLRRISLSMDSELLRRVTELAKTRRMSRSKLFALAIERELARAAKME
jgi:hypothetical protein